MHWGTSTGVYTDFMPFFSIRHFSANFSPQEWYNTWMDASPRGLCPIFVRTTVRANPWRGADSRTKIAVRIYLLPRGHSRQVQGIPILNPVHSVHVHKVYIFVPVLNHNTSLLSWCGHATFDSSSIFRVQEAYHTSMDASDAWLSGGAQ